MNKNHNTRYQPVNITSKIITGALLIFSFISCQQNFMYDDLLSQGSPEYRIQLQFYNAGNPMSGYQGYMEQTSPTVSRNMQGEPSANLGSGSYYFALDSSAITVLHARSGSYEIVIDSPPPEIYRFTMTVQPESADYNKSPAVKVSGPAGFSVSVLAVLPQTPENRFRIVMNPPVFLNKNYSGGLFATHPFDIKNYLGDMVNASIMPYSPDGITMPEWHNLSINLYPNFYGPGEGQLEINGSAYTMSPISGSPSAYLGDFIVTASDQFGAYADLRLPLRLRLQRAFVSDIVTPGDMSGLTAAYPVCAGYAEGIQKANCACQKMAAKAKLPRADSFRALLSGFMGGLPVDASCNLKNQESTGCSGNDAGPWYQPYNGSNQNLIAGSESGLWSVGTGGNLNRDQFGKLRSGFYAWTGTNASGADAGSNCNNWADGTNATQGTIGSTDANDAQWTNAMGDYCGNPRHIYCFEGPPAF